MRQYFPGFMPLQQIEVLIQLLLAEYFTADAVIRQSNRLRHAAIRLAPFSSL